MMGADAGEEFFAAAGGLGLVAFDQGFDVGENGCLVGGGELL